MARKVLATRGVGGGRAIAGRPLVINSSCFQTALKVKITEIDVMGTWGVTVLQLETMCISCWCRPSKRPFASKVEHK